jgi:hypothetical protein
MIREGNKKDFELVQLAPRFKPLMKGDAASKTIGAARRLVVLEFEHGIHLESLQGKESGREKGRTAAGAGYLVRAEKWHIEGETTRKDNNNFSYADRSFRRQCKILKDHKQTLNYCS